MENKIIRKMNLEDLAHVINIEYQCFKSKYTQKEFENELLDNPFAKLYVLEVNGDIVGYIDFWITFETAQLCKIAINPINQNKGYSKLLLDSMHDECIREGCEVITLEVRVSNHKAISLYEHYDYVKANIRKNYYEDGEDAYLMVKGV